MAEAEVNQIDVAAALDVSRQRFARMLVRKSGAPFALRDLMLLRRRLPGLFRALMLLLSGEGSL